MNERLDRVEVGLAEKIERVSVALDGALLLAAAVESEFEKTSYDLQHRHLTDIEAIKSVLAAEPDMRITFSGFGLGAFADEDNELDTGYLRMTSETGRFSNLYVADFSDADCRVIKEDEVDVDDDRHGSYGAEMLRLSRILSPPPSGSRLVLELLMDETDEIQEFRGPTLRAKGVQRFSIVDLLGVQIDAIDVAVDEKTLYSAEEVGAEIHLEANLLCDEFESTAFLKKSARAQARYIESQLSRLNRVARVDRFEAFLDPDIIYVPNVTENSAEFVKIENGENYPGMVMKLITLDVLEHQAILDGKKIRSSKDMIDAEAGICLVGEVDVVTQHMFKLPSTIVWVPLNSQGFNFAIQPKDIETI